jgi:glycogen operon protein
VVTAVRRRQVRNFLVTLLLSQGVPMLAGGDEMGRTQAGNNNAYCQDGPMSWLGWPGDPEARDLADLVRQLVALRQAHPVFRRTRFFTGRAADGGRADLVWLRSDGKEMAPDDWADPGRRAIGLLLAGDTLDEVDDAGAPVRDDTFLVLLNADPAAVTFTLPPGADEAWTILVDTGAAPSPPAAAAEAVALEGRSAMVLMRRP